MTEKSIIIIGAGIAGLSAGCYGQMNGYRTRIFEMHSKSGGLCTAWKRKGYNIGTPGWVTGFAPGDDFNRFWQELGAMQGQTMIPYDEYAQIEGRDGKVFTFYTNIDRLEQHMLELAPEDEALIKDFAQALRAFTRFNMSLEKAPELYGFLDKVKMMLGILPHMRVMSKWQKMTLKDFANKFQNPFMREALTQAFPLVFFFNLDIPIMMLLSTFASMHLKRTGYLLGGPTEFVGAIEKRYLDLGGELNCRSRVVKILVEADPTGRAGSNGRGSRAVGVQLEDGSEHRADVVISAADGRTTLFDMLGDEYLDAEIRDRYATRSVCPSIHYISLGVNRTFEDLPPLAGGHIFALDEPLTTGKQEWNWLAVHMYNFDPSTAPEGKTRLRIMLAADYEYWKNLREQDRERYKAEKEQLADKLVAALDQRYPGLAEQVEMRDVATPATFERFTGNWQGGYLGWLSRPEDFVTNMSKTVPGLDNFYMVGTWVGQGSLAYAAVSGRHATQIICHEDKKQFKTSLP